MFIVLQEQGKYPDVVEIALFLEEGALGFVLALSQSGLIGLGNPFSLSGAPSLQLQNYRVGPSDLQGPSSLKVTDPIMRES